jgi:hypothetical protein
MSAPSLFLSRANNPPSESFVWLISHDCPIKQTVDPTVLVRIPELHRYREQHDRLMSQWTNAETREERDRLDEMIDAFEQQCKNQVQSNVLTAVTSVKGVPWEDTYSAFFGFRRQPFDCPMPPGYQNYQFLGSPERNSPNPLAICMYILEGEIQAAAMLEYYDYDHEIPDNKDYTVTNLAYLCAVPGNGTRCVEHIVAQHKLNNIVVRTKALPRAEGFWEKAVAKNETAQEVLHSHPKMYVWTHGLVTIVDQPPNKSVRRV